MGSIISGSNYSYWNDVSFFLLFFLKKSDKHSPRAIYSSHNFNRFDNLKRWKISKQILDDILLQYTFLNKKCSINQENLKRQTNKENTIANTEARLILRIFLIFLSNLSLNILTNYILIKKVCNLKIKLNGRRLYKKRNNLDKLTKTWNWNNRLTPWVPRTYIYVLHFCNEQPSAFLQNDQRHVYTQRFIETNNRSNKQRFVPATTDLYIHCKYFTRATNIFSPRRPSLFTKNLKIKFSYFIWELNRF